MTTTAMMTRNTASAACFGGFSRCAHEASMTPARAISILRDAGILASIFVGRIIVNLLAVLGLSVAADFGKIPGA